MAEQRAETAHLHVGDVVTLTGTVRTVSSIVPHGHLRVTLDFDEGASDGRPQGLHEVVRYYGAREVLAAVVDVAAAIYGEDQAGTKTRELLAVVCSSPGMEGDQ